MRQLLILLSLLPLSLVAQTSYFLRPVTSIEDNCLYVFVQQGMVVTGNLVDGSLNNTRNIDMDNVLETEVHVWKYDSKMLYNKQEKKYLCNPVRNNKATADLSFEASPRDATKWKMDFLGDSCRIVVDKTDGRNIARNEKNNFKAYSSSSYPNKFCVYKLVPRLEDHVTHTLTDSLATICLPRDVASWEGCEVYQISYVEDSCMTLSPLQGNMIAGHSYVIRATTDRQEFHYTGETFVSNPSSADGLVGNLSSSPQDVSNQGYILHRNAWRPARDNVKINSNHSYLRVQ